MIQLWWLCTNNKHAPLLLFLHKYKFCKFKIHYFGFYDKNDMSVLIRNIFKNASDNWLCVRIFWFSKLTSDKQHRNSRAAHVAYQCVDEKDHQHFQCDCSFELPVYTAQYEICKTRKHDSFHEICCRA